MSSENERLKILGMLDDGIISVEDALKLIAEIAQVKPPTESQIQDLDRQPQESVFCIPGGKCYTLDELKKLEKPIIPKFDLNGEPGHAANKADRRDQHRN